MASRVDLNEHSMDRAENEDAIENPTDGHSLYAGIAETDMTNDELHLPSPPEEAKDLPDIQRLLQSLEDNENTLDNAKEPPSLFARPGTASYFKDITQKRMEVEDDSDVDDYLNNFLSDVKDDILMIGQISLEDVKEEEKRLRDEHISYLEQQQQIEQLIRTKILILEEEAKKRVAAYLKEKRRLAMHVEDIQQQRERMMMDRLNKAFRKSENQLIAVLEKRKAEVKRYYGDLIESDGHYGGNNGRRWKVDWEKTPQPIQIKLVTLRGVKDKLPAGRYVLMVSLYNRLGGHVMRWSRLKGQHWAGSTLPVPHDGRFYNVEMKFDQSVFTVIPSKSEIKPGMVLVFELFLLRGAVVSTDRVVGWGCFPIVDGTFSVIEGKYKTPFLRGEMDNMIDKHEKVEHLMAHELDHWLCNAYFEVIKLPRFLAGQNEYEVELQFSSGMIAFPDRIGSGAEESRDGEVPVPGSLDDMKSGGRSAMNMSKTTTNTDFSSVSQSTISSDTTPPKVQIEDSDNNTSDPSLRKRRPVSTVGSRIANKDKKVDFSDSDSDIDPEDAFYQRDEDFYPVKGQPGLWYKREEYNPVDKYHKKLYSLYPKTPLLSRQLKRRKLTYQERLEEHQFAVMTQKTGKGRMERPGSTRMQYVRRQFLGELGLSEWRSREFWGMLLMFKIVFFARIYLHYICQWIVLQALEIPINKFDFLPYTVTLNYQNTLLEVKDEATIVLIGPFGNIILFTLMVVSSWGIQKCLNGVPDIASKFFFAFGLQASLDPILILIVDCSLQRYRNLGGDNPIADCAKLYWYFERTEGNGLGGIFVTIAVYFFTIFSGAAILYMYFLRVHNNGRMLDVYWRLHGLEDVFFLPYDLELSNQELAYLVRKAEQYRGEEGERRKVAVTDYVWQENDLEDEIWDENASISGKSNKEGLKKEITTHVSIHTLHLDGLRELYRHFLRLPDGGIVEVFGDLSVAGVNKDITRAVTKTTLHPAGDKAKQLRPATAGAFS